MDRLVMNYLRQYNEDLDPNLSTHLLYFSLLLFFGNCSGIFLLSIEIVVFFVYRHYHISLPYTVILMLVGAVLGAFYHYELIKRLTFIADLTPVQILAIFLPILIFESAFSCDPHIFIKCLGQILTLAILGRYSVKAKKTF